MNWEPSGFALFLCGIVAIAVVLFVGVGLAVAIRRSSR